MRIDTRILTAPLLAFSLAVACGGSDSVLTGSKGNTGGSDSGVSNGGSSNGGSSGNTSSTGGRATGTGGRNTSGATGNGGSSGNAGASAGGTTADGGPAGDSSVTDGSAGAGGTSAGGAGAGGRAAGGTGAGGTAAGGAGGRGTGGRGAGGGTVGTACQRLGDCCDTVPLVVRTQCTTYANAGLQPQCSALLGFFCTGDAGVPPPPQDAANACSALDACCPQTGAQQAQCNQVVSLGNAGLCSSILSILCP